MGADSDIPRGAHLGGSQYDKSNFHHTFNATPPAGTSSRLGRTRTGRPEGRPANDNVWKFG